jgi:hypothetical protein
MNAETEIATPVPGTRLFLIDDEGVVFSRDRQELYALNTAAAYLWCLIEEAWDKARMAHEYGASFDVSEAVANSHVSKMLEDFFNLGLIDISDRNPPAAHIPSRPVVDAVPPSEIPPLREAPIVAQRFYRILETDYLVRFSAIEQIYWIDAVLKGFEQPVAPESAVVLDLRHDEREIFVYRDGGPVGKCDVLDKLAPLVKSDVWTNSINNYDYFLNLHTGVLAHGDGCVLLPAAAGSGKSSTTAALVRDGFSYLSDEVALLEVDCSVRALPLAMCFKDTGWDVVSGYFEGFDQLPVHRRVDGKIVKYLPLPEERCADAARTYPVKAIVFPKYTPGQANKFEPLSKTQALDRLFRECMSIPNELTEEAVSRIVDWIKGVDCHTLEFSELNSAASTIRASLGESIP